MLFLGLASSSSQYTRICVRCRLLSSISHLSSFPAHFGYGVEISPRSRPQRPLAGGEVFGVRPDTETSGGARERRARVRMRVGAQQLHGDRRHGRQGGGEVAFGAAPVVPRCHLGAGGGRRWRTQRAGERRNERDTGAVVKEVTLRR